MPSHFDEKSGVIKCDTNWGSWWQTVEEVYINVDLPPETKSKDIKVNIKVKTADCIIKQKTIFQGELSGPVRADETVWVIEDKNKLEIMLVKGNSSKENEYWPSLLRGQYAPDPQKLLEIRKKLDLERYQIEHPGFDFSGASLDKVYE